jgi:small-conductance mechanosensitive channel
MRSTHKPARPHLIRAAVAAVVAIAGIVAADLGQLRSERGDEATNSELALVLIGSGVLLIAGILAARALAGAVRETLDERMGPGRSAGAGLLVTIFGYAIVVLATLRAVGVDLSALLLGGALTGIIIGIAAQQTLGNFFAGIVLMVVRPFSVGETIALRSGPLGGEYEGLVTDVGLFYVQMSTPQGPVALPNAGVLASAIGPGVKAAPEVDEDEVDESAAQRREDERR